jgi:hypothetical protein
MWSDGHTHLILAGDPQTTRHVHLALPKDLADKLVEIIPANENDKQTDVVMATLSSFIEHEEQESRSATQRLVEGLRSQNLAVSGSAATLDAMYRGEGVEQSDALISLGGVGFLLRIHLNTQTARTVGLG